MTVFGYIAIVMGVSPLLTMIAVVVWRAFSYDREYNRIVKTLIRGGMIELYSAYSVKAGNLQIWVGNWPYQYGNPWGCGVSEDLRISFPTKCALRRHIKLLSSVKVLEKARGAA